MKDYSQNGEQKIILDYFGDRKGMFLDIGANDGVTLSNTYALSLLGWDGVLVEPSPKAFTKLEENYKDMNTNNYLVNVAIGTETKTVNLLESDSHLHNGDIALLSTLKPTEVARWKGTQKFEPVEVECFSWKDFLELNETMNPFSMISIDAEGMDWDILQQIDLSGTRLLCIEWNGNQDIKEKIIAYCKKFYLNFHYENGENIILVR